MTLWWLTYPLLGIFGGFVAGLFGVGGGLTLVPFMYMLFVAQNFPPDHVMHLALGTSMATIVSDPDIQVAVNFGPAAAGAVGDYISERCGISE